MTKNPSFWVLSVLLLLSASFGVSSAHAAAPNAATFTNMGCLNDGWVFHLECSGTGSSRVCELSQKQVIAPDVRDPDEDFACWSDLSVVNSTIKGVRSALEETTNDNNISKIVLKSSLNFGLHANSVCNLNVRPLGPDHAGFDGDGHIIWGLCYNKTTQNSSFGLFEEFHGSFTNVTFDQAMVTASTGGILAIKLKDADISKVTVIASSVQGQFVGGLAASAEGTSSITNVTFNSSLYLYPYKYSGNEGRVGGLIGAVNGGILSISDVTISGVDASNYNFEESDDLKLGGLFGFVSNNSELNVSNVSIKGDLTPVYGTVGGVCGASEASSLTIDNVTLNPGNLNGYEGGRAVGGVVGRVMGGTSTCDVNISNVMFTGDLAGDTIGGVIGISSVIDGAACNLTIEKVGFKGDYYGSNSSGYVGGIVGYAKGRSSYSYSVPSLTIKNTYSVGKIGGLGSQGYIIGYSSDYSDAVFNNYHFSSQDKVTIGIGNFSSWNDGGNPMEQGSIYGNVRNASLGNDAHKNAEKKLGYHYKYYIEFGGSSISGPFLDFFERNNGDRVANALADSTEMRSGLFAALLNYNLESKGEAPIWVSDASVNGGLPTFAQNSSETNRLIVLMVDDRLDAELKDIQTNPQASKKLNNEYTEVYYFLDDSDQMLPAVITIDSGFTFYTDKDGKLPSDIQADLDLIRGVGDDQIGQTFSIFTEKGDDVSDDGIYNSSQFWRAGEKPTSTQKYFCFKDNGSNLLFHQSLFTNPNEYCFDNWYDDNADHSIGTPDAYSYAKDWLSGGLGGRSIVLTSDIEFAGKQTVGYSTSCVDAPNAFKGKYLSLGENDIIRSLDGNRFTISGLCYTDGNNNVTIGFVKIENKKGNIENINFDNVYFVLNSSGNTSSGVVWLDVDGVDHLGDISVENSEFQGSKAGAFAGSIKNVGVLQNISVSGTKLRSYEGYIGGVVGYVENVKEVKNIRVDNPNLHAIGSSNPTAVGAVFGYALINWNDDVSITDISVSGIFTASSYYQSVMGGIVGWFDLMGPKSISFSDISVNADEIQVSAEIGGLVGVFDVKDGGAGTTVSIERASVTSNNYSFSTQAPSYDVFEPHATGGLIGYFRANFTSDNDNFSLNIKDTYTIVDLRGNSTDGVGYLVGAVKAYLVGAANAEYHSKIKYDIVNNYHYGKSDAGVISGIGAFVDATNSATAISADYWRRGSISTATGSISAATGSSVTRNFRNAITTGTPTLAADGDLRYVSEPVFYDDGTGTITTYVNGVIPKAQMESPLLAAVLNMDDGVWTYASGVNNDLPFFADVNAVTGDRMPIYAVRFNMDAFDGSASDDQKQTLQTAITGGTRSLEYVEGASSNGLVLVTDNTGKLNSNDVSFVSSLADNVNTSWVGSANAPALDVNNLAVYDNGGYVYTYQGPSNYFCFDDATSKILNFSQVKASSNPASNPGSNYTECFEYWYDKNAVHNYSSTTAVDAYSYIRIWLNGNSGGTIFLNTDIVFAGFNEQSGACIDAQNALGGRNYGISLSNNQNINGNGHTISGLCHIENNSGSEVRFVVVEQGASVTDITFSNVYFKVSGVGGGGQVGVFALSTNAKLDGKITVENSKFIVTGSDAYAGAIDGHVESFAGVSNVTVKNVEVVAVHAGAIVGYVEGYSSNSPIIISNINVIGNNSIKNLNDAGYVGGVIGYVRGFSKNHVKFENISVKASITGLYAGGLVGNTSEYPDDVANNVNNPDASFTIQKVSIFADIKSEDPAMGNSNQYAGGLVGYFGLNTGFNTYGAIELNINNTYSISSISSTNTSAELGYLIGGLEKFGDPNNSTDYKTYKFNITDNYYFRTVNADPVRLGISGFVNDASATVTSVSDADWLNPPADIGVDGSVIARNFHDVSSPYAPTGDLRYDASEPIIHATNGTYANGSILDDDMKSPRFAAVLNMDDGVWTLDASQNNGLPFFADVNAVTGDRMPIYAVGLDKATFDTRAGQDEKDKWNTAVTTGGRRVESFDATHDAIIFFTDNTGKLDPVNDIALAQNLVGGEYIWKNTSYELDNSFDANVLFKYEKPTKYFCFDGDYKNKLSQTTDRAAAEAAGQTCYEYWYKDGVDDAYAHIRNIYNNIIGIQLTSDIEFAGKEINSNGDIVCVDAPNAFKGMPMVMNSGRLTGGDWNTVNHKISGLCYISNEDDKEIGFADNGTLGYVIISDVYFKLTGQGETKAGVYVNGKASTSYGDVKIESSYFKAKYAGAMIGYQNHGVVAYNNDLFINDVVVDGTYAGGVVGYVDVKQSTYYDTHTTGNITTNNVTVKGEYAGGIIGFYNDDKLEDVSTNSFHNITVDGSIEGSSYAGGIVGFATFFSSLSVYDVRVLADVSATGNAAYGGGLFGKVDSKSTDARPLRISTTFSKADITGSPSATLGYLIGSFGDIVIFFFFVFV